MLRDATPGPFSKTAPLSARRARRSSAAVERRADKVWAPRWVLPLTWLRGIMQPLSQRGNRDAIEEAVQARGGRGRRGAPPSSRLAAERIA